MNEIEEQLDLVDSNDIKIGSIGRSEIGTLADDGGRYVRTACAFICNKKGELWIPRRTTNKQIAPNGLDFSMAEHMGVDETYLDAAIRGFKEELNLSINKSSLELLGILGPRPGLPYFGAYYLYKSNESPAYNPEDFTEASWISPQQLIEQIENGDTAKGNLVPAVKLLLLQKSR